MERLEQYITQVRGISYSPNDIVSSPKDGYLPLLKANNIQNGKLNLSDLIYVREQIVKPEQLIRKGDILIAASSGSKNIVGKSVFCKESIYATFGAFCKIIRPNRNIYASYVNSFFNTDLYRKHINRVIQGANINNLRTEDINSLKIPIFPLEDQVKIAHLLTQAENLITQRRESIALIDDYIKSVFLEIFGIPILNNKKWASDRLGKFIQIKHGFAFKSEYFSAKGDYILLTPGNFCEKGGYKDRGDNQKFYTGNISQDYILRKNDLLVAMTEQAPGLLGSPILVPSNNRFLHNQRLGLVQFDTKEFNEYFLFHFFANPLVKGVIHRQATGTKVRHTSPSKIEDVPLFHPPIDLQKKFAEIVKKAEILKQQMQQSLQELETLFASLSQKAFKGELNLLKLKVTYEEEYSATDNDRTEPKPINWDKVSVEKKPISEMTLDDYYGIPDDIQQEHGSIEQHIFDWEFFFKKHFQDRPITSDIVEDLYLKYNYERGQDFSYEEFAQVIFAELKKENPYFKQVFKKEDKKIELRLNS